jgi:DNA-binding MarR family transcriptional regulator
MNNKAALIQQAVRLQDDINQYELTYKLEKWLSVDITISQLKSIIFIDSRKKASFKELAEALGVTPSVVTGIVDRLVKQGMVKRRHPVNSNDRRIQWLVLSEKGQAFLDGIRQQTRDDITQVLDTLSSEDLSALVRGSTAFLEAVKTHINNYPGKLASIVG